jgi:hypothetical protein
MYVAQHDASYDKEKDEWLESKCKDPECDYCIDRPDKPSDALGTHIKLAVIEGIK